MSEPKIMVIHSLAAGESLDPRIEGQIVSIAASIDGENVQLLISRESWQRIEENVDWFREPLPEGSAKVAK